MIKRQRIQRQASPESHRAEGVLPLPRAFAEEPSPREAPSAPAAFAFGQIPTLSPENDLAPKAPLPSPLGSSDVPGDRELIDRAERSFGMPLADVRMHTDDGRAERHGAAAVTEGPDIHFASAVVHPERGPEPRLAAHELGHVVQQRSPIRGGSLEVEAEAGGRAVASGQPFHVVGGTGGPVVQAKGFLEWFAANTFWADEVAASRSAEGQRQRDETAKLAPRAESYFGRDAAVVGEDGAAKQIPTKGEVKKEDKGLWSWAREAFGWSEGTEKHRTAPDGAHTTEFDTTKKEVGLGGIETEAARGTKTEVVDVAATGAVAKSQLEAEIKLATSDARVAALKAAIQQIEAAPNDGVALKAICEQHKLVVEPKYKVISEDSVSDKTKLELNIWKAKAGHGTEQETRKTEGGVTDATTVKHDQSVDLREGKVEWGSSTETSKTQADGSTHTETAAGKPTTSGSVTVGGGAATYQREESSGWSKTGAEGKPVSGSKTTKGSDRSFVASDKDGVGFKSGQSSKVATTTGQITDEASKDAHVGITDKGLLGDASIGKKRTGEKYQGEVKASADGAFLIEIKPPEADANPPRYAVITTIRAGLALNANAGTKKKEGPDADEGKKVSASAAGTASATMVYTHLLSLDEAKAYLGAADKTEAAAPGAATDASYPEFGILAKLKLLAEGEEGASPAAVLGSSDTAARMQSGDSVELVLSAGVSGKLAASGRDKTRGAGAEVSGGVSYTRTLKVERGDKAEVKLTVGFVDTDKLAGSVSGTLEGVTASVGASRATAEGDQYEFALDTALPDYQSCYQLILGAWTREQLKALGGNEQIKQHITKATASDSHATGVEGSVGVAGIAIGSGQERSGSRELSKTALGHEAKYTGATTDKFAISPGVDAFAVRQTNSTTGTVDSKGQLSAELTTKTEATDLGTTLANAGTTIKEWFGIKEGKEVKTTDVLKGVVEKTPGERVKELLEKTYIRLAGYKLSPQDVQTVIARAADQTKWMHCSASYHVLDPMRSLRAELLDPSIDPALVPDKDNASQLERAGALARAKALADFMEATGGDGMETMVNMLRYWGAGMQTESTAVDLGTRYEWPATLGEERTQFEKAQAQVSALADRLTQLLGQPGPVEKGREVVEKIVKTLDAVFAAVGASAAIKSERARAEMLDEIGKAKASAIAERKEFENLAIEYEKAAGDSRVAAGEKPGPLPAVEADVLADKTPAERLATERIATLLVELVGFKAKEREMFAAAREVMTRWGGGGMPAQEEMSSLRELYEFWTMKVLELRETYTTAKVPKADWKVSNGPDDRRHTASTEPFVDGMIDVWKEGGGENYQVVGWASIWRARWKHY